MADEMGLETLEQSTAEPEEENFRIIAYLAEALPEEFRNVVRAPYLNSLRHGNDDCKLINQDSYYEIYGRLIETLLVRPKAVVRIAILKDKTVLGWSLTEMDIVHYVWVKNEVRRQGIAKSLLPMKFNTITHITNRGISIWASKYPHARYIPCR